jgi:hypothetical protein
VIGPLRAPNGLFMDRRPARRKQAMKKLILFATALVMASGASTYAQDEYGASKHRRWMSSHAQMLGYEPVVTYRRLPPAMMAPPYPYYGIDPSYRYYGSADARYGFMDEESAIGRTND